MNEWDVFISHASEDKEKVAAPLADRLREAGMRVWLDEHELLLGDSLRRKIDEGLANSKWGIVVLSPHFFQKEWPQSELDALLSREMQGQRVLLPVWHDITAEAICKYSPLIAARLAVKTENGLDAVVAAILKAVQRGRRVESGEVDADFLSRWSALATGRGGSVEELLSRSRVWVGIQIGDYLLKQQIGYGGAGVVFKATHRSLGTTAALKLLFPLSADSERLIGATLRAVRALAALHHPGIAKLYDFGFVDAGRLKCPYLVHEYISGKDLFRWCKDDAPTANERIRTALGIAEGLNASHRCSFVGEYGFAQTGILHGDIKPSNVLVRDADQSPVLIDFMVPDLQRMRAQPYTEDRLRGWRKVGNEYKYFDHSTAIFGTPGYMPPEQEIDGIVTPASDVFSLGRTFAKLLWERPIEHVMAFDNENKDTLLARLVLRMVQPQPKQRPSLEDVLVALKELSTERKKSSLRQFFRF